MKKLYYAVLLLVASSSIVMGMDFAKSLDSQQETIQCATHFYFSPSMHVHEQDPHTLSHMLTQRGGERAFEQPGLRSSASEPMQSSQIHHLPLLPTHFSHEEQAAVSDVVQQTQHEHRWQYAHPQLQPSSVDLDPSSPSFDHTQLSRWLDRDSSTWVFVSPPDMTNDPEIRLFEQHIREYDAQSLCEDIVRLVTRLEDLWSTERTARFKESRRISFIMKYIKHPIMQQLLAVHRMKKLEDAEKAVQQLEQGLLREHEIHVERERSIPLDIAEKIKLRQRAQMAFVQRRDYQERLHEEYLQKQRQEAQIRQTPHISENIPQSDGGGAAALTEDDTPAPSSNRPGSDAWLAKIWGEDIAKVDPQIQEIYERSVTVDPKTDFSEYIQQCNAMLDMLRAQGLISWMDIPHLAKVFAEGAVENAIDIGSDPVGYAKDVAQGWVEVVKQSAHFLMEVYDQPEEVWVSEYEMARFEKKAAERMVAITQLCSQMRETVSQMSLDDFVRLSGRMAVDYCVLKGIDLGIDKIRSVRFPARIAENPLLIQMQEHLELLGTRHPELTTPEGLRVPTVQQMGREVVKDAEREASLLKRVAEEGGGTKAVAQINQGCEAILRNGYYEVNGFKFSKVYYERLWKEGRKAPSLVVREILESIKPLAPDSIKSGFFRYVYGNWEMVYNPTTKEVWHLQPIKMK